MFKIQAALGVISLLLCLFCVIEAIMTDSALMRNLPKPAWILLILFFPLIGSIAWLVAGRPEARPRQAPSAFPEYDARPGRVTGTTPESDAEFLRRTRARAEEQRRRYEQERRAKEAPDADQGGTADREP